ncbi:MAG TPA: protease inhibitor I9 family protein, partial [Chitinophagaceae bacterium]|nr:protease inhibitor I9 family protein [Chitinophagaceae bacterium]
MQKNIILFVSVFFIVSCKKNNESTGSDPREEHDCVIRASGSNSDIIASQYIVSYSPVINSRTASRVSLDETSKSVLRRNSISVSALKKSFPGEPGGFIAKMSAAEVEILRKDEAIEAIEPDRIISLSHCFTVVEPRLVTWNITRVGYHNGIGKTAWIIDSGIDFNHPDLTVDQA